MLKRERGLGVKIDGARRAKFERAGADQQARNCIVPGSAQKLVKVKEKEKIVDAASAGGYERWWSTECRSRVVGRGSEVWRISDEGFLSNFSRRRWSGLVGV